MRQLEMVALHTTSSRFQWHIMENQINELTPYITLSSLAMALASFVIASFAVFLAFRGDRRKAGIEVRCNFSVASAIWSKEPWVGKVLLENVKDRSVVIYRIYLEVGHGFYIVVEDLIDNPLTLGPYEVYQKEYDPIEFYTHGLSRLTGLLDDNTKRRRIVLTTSEGRYIPKSDTRTYDDPFFDTILKNFSTGIARPHRLFYKGRSYGSEAKYILTLVDHDRKESVIPIYPRDYETKKIRDVSLTRESLVSKQALECLLERQSRAGTASFISFQVVDLESSRRIALEDYPRSLVVVHQGWFSYHVVARLLTIWKKWKLRRKNKKRGS